MASPIAEAIFAVLSDHLLIYYMVFTFPSVVGNFIDVDNIGLSQLHPITH